MRFAVVGFGRIGRRHAAIISGHSQCELAAIIDIDGSLHKSEEYPTGIPFYSSLEEYLGTNPSCDVINLCTPNGIHCSQAADALRTGLHVVIEKPMGLHALECEEVMAVAKAANKQVFVVKQNRYSPPVKWLRRVLKDKMLGEIYMVQINCFWNRNDNYYESSAWKGRSDLDGGVLFTQFSHFIDIMYWMFGDIQNIQTRLYNFNHQASTEFADSGVSTFEFMDEGIGQLQFTTSVWDQNMESSITILGSRGSAKLGGQYMNEISYLHAEGVELPELPESNPPNHYGKYQGSAANHHFMIENVLDVLHKNVSPTASGDDGLKVVDIIERIYRAAE